MQHAKSATFIVHNMIEVKVKKMAPYWPPLYALTSDWL